MNEIIKEIWNQSKTSGVHSKFGEYDKYSSEKFAELIILECLSKISGLIVEEDSDEDYIDPYRNWNLALEHAKLEILEHFGM